MLNDITVVRPGTEVIILVPDITARITCVSLNDSLVPSYELRWFDSSNNLKEGWFRRSEFELKRLANSPTPLGFILNAES